MPDTKATTPAESKTFLQWLNKSDAGQLLAFTANVSGTIQGALSMKSNGSESEELFTYSEINRLVSAKIHTSMAQNGCQRTADGLTTASRLQDEPRSSRRHKKARQLTTFV